MCFFLILNDKMDSEQEMMIREMNELTRRMRILQRAMSQVQDRKLHQELSRPVAKNDSQQDPVETTYLRRSIC